MRIALLSAEYPPQPGGVGDYTHRLGAALVDRGHNIFVLTIHDSRFTIYDLGPYDSTRKSKIQNRKSDWGWRSWRAISTALDLTQPDVLHIQYQTGAYGMRPAINLLPWRLRDLPHRPAVAVTAHDLLLPYLFPKAGPLRRWVTRRLLADADAVVVTNEADLAKVVYGAGREMRDRLIPHSPSPVLIPIGSNIAVAPPPGYDRTIWRARLQIAPDQTLVAYFGLISRSKGLDLLLSALARLPPSLCLLVVGGAVTASEDRAYAEEIRALIARLSLEQRVIITGHCPEPEVSAHLLAADLAVLPFLDGASFRRGSLLAALAHGLPVVTTFPSGAAGTSGRNDIAPSSGARLVEGENVLFTPPGDAHALARMIERVMRDAELRAHLAAGGRALAAHFGWPEIAARHEELYTLLSKR